MTIIAAALFFLIIAALFIYALPPLIGFVIICVVNGTSKSWRGKYAPVLWNLLTAAVTFYATRMLWRDAMNDSIDTGPQPFVILIVYGVLSLIMIAMLHMIEQSKPFKAPPVRTQRRANPSVTQEAWQLRETWEDYPAPDYDAVHTYCQVAFDESGKTFYYRTRNPHLKVGDRVFVPVGREYRKEIGRIVSKKDYIGRYAPYPLEKTKHIIGKADG